MATIGSSHPSGTEGGSAGSTARVRVAPGRWEPVSGSVYVVVSGLMQRHVTVKRTVALELLGPRDLLGTAPLEEDLLGVQVDLSALTPVELVTLTGGRLARAASHPQLVTDLLNHASGQQRRMAVHRAICQLPRVEERLLAIFWLLAERWGRVGAEGVVLPIRLSHEALGQLVGARRPTITLALRGLDERGSVTRRSDRTWLIDPATQHELRAQVGPPALQAFMLDQPAELSPPAP